jgi:uncharacterized RDD family membrane protein YckC
LDAGAVKTGLMTNGLNANRVTDSQAEGNVPEQLCVDAVVNGLGDSGEALAAESGLESATDKAVEAGAPQSADSWREELAARLERYRTRRKPRSPRYPSLLLPFEAPESWSRPAPLSGSSEVAGGKARMDFELDRELEADEAGEGLAEAHTMEAAPRHILEPLPPEHIPVHLPETSGKVLEFPRSAAIPIFHRSDLADPVFDRPRIVEAPEILPPPPALGGMLIEPVHQEAAEGIECAVASPSASIPRRALAVVVDGGILGAAVAAMGAIFIRFNPSLNPVGQAIPFTLISGLEVAGALGGVAVLLWAAYEFLLVVYTGSTPGLRAARLRLAAFDGSPLNRRTRRWRVLASFLSAFSAGLGYFWCVLDQDGLCWHDRITHSYVQAAVKAE